MIKYLIANKILVVDLQMQDKPIDFKEHADEFKELIAFEDRKMIGE